MAGTSDVLNLLERNCGHEAMALPRLGDLGVELVDLLEREALGLVDHGPDEEDADEAASTPDEEDFGAEIDTLGYGAARVLVEEVSFVMS